LDCLNDALSIMNAVYGPIHRDIADVSVQMALVHYHSKELSATVEAQQRAVIIYERLHGPDHHDTMFAYANLALFLENSGRFASAASVMSRAIYTNRLLYSKVHPDTASLLNITAMLLQELGKFEQSIVYLEEAAVVYQRILGPQHPQVGMMFHSIAITHGQMQNWREALEYEKKNYNILVSANLPENDSKMNECNIYLSTFTMRAVARQVETNQSKLSQNIAQNAARSMQKQIEKVQKAMTPEAPPATMASTRNVNELLSYINSGEKPKISVREKRKANKGGVTAPKPSEA